MDNRVKQDIFEWISKPENEDLLETLRLMKENSSSGDWIDDLTESERNSIEKGIKDHKKGDTLSSEEFWAKNA
ncbi:MAG: hypothetical protein RI575_04625 [Balneolaceae bacterium]|nr:hypothetical protein [Balneolaceae bacterium]MDR9407464.1 hypothetical protein [Balneolaceae bacterium]